MDGLLKKLERERRKMNELGEQSLKNNAPLADNKKLKKQSKKVDQLITQYMKRR